MTPPEPDFRLSDFLRDSVTFFYSPSPPGLREGKGIVGNGREKRIWKARSFCEKLGTEAKFLILNDFIVFYWKFFNLL